MPEPGGVGGSSSASSGSSSSSSSSSSSDESNSSSSSQSTETKTESIANSPTTEETLSGSSSKSNDSKSSSGDDKSDTNNTNNDSDSDKETTTNSNESNVGTNNTGSGKNATEKSNEASDYGVGSLDAAVASSYNSLAVEPLTLGDINTDSTPEENPENQDPSLTTPGSIVGDSVQGAIDLTRTGIDRTGLEAAADVLTKGNGGNLPAPGIGSRSDLANKLTQSATMTAPKAMDVTPFSANAKSTQILSETADITGPLSKASRIAGNVVAPVIGAAEALTEELPADATIGERIANTVGGALKEIDDGAVSGAAGAGAATAQTMGGIALSGTVAGAPAGAALVATAPITGTAAAVGATMRYDNSTVDQAVDNFVDNTVEPFVADVIDGSVSAANTVADAVSDGADWVGDKADAVSDAVSDGASWVGEKANQAKEDVLGWFK